MTDFLPSKCVLEVDFLNNIIISTEFTVKAFDQDNNPLQSSPFFAIDKEMMQRFLDSIEGFWHNENDQLQSLHFYADGHLLCQRRKLKYDFANQRQTYSTYNYVGFTAEQVSTLKQQIINFVEAEKLVRILKVETSIKKVDEEILFFEKTFLKRMQERNNILAVTDWRILPDVQESYEGERDMWIKFRQAIRNSVYKDPESYPTPLDFFRDVKTMKWPVDPKVYRNLYPDGVDSVGNPVEYLDPEDPDQWVERDVESSRDLVESRLSHISSMRQGYIESKRVVSAAVKEMMKNLRLEDFVEAGIDYTKIYTKEELEQFREV